MLLKSSDNCVKSNTPVNTLGCGHVFTSAVQLTLSVMLALKRTSELRQRGERKTGVSTKGKDAVEETIAEVSSVSASAERIRHLHSSPLKASVSCDFRSGDQALPAR